MYLCFCIIFYSFDKRLIHTFFVSAVGTPPDPAPPEVPPRGPSHHHPLLTAQRRGGPHGPGSTGSPHYQDPPSEDGYQQPQQNVFLSQGVLSIIDNSFCFLSFSLIVSYYI